MNIQIREGVFETNSSSTHSLVIATKSEFESFKKGETVYCQYNAGPFKEGKFYSTTEVNNWALEHEDEYDEWDFQNYDDFFEEHKAEFRSLMAIEELLNYEVSSIIV